MLIVGIPYLAPEAIAGAKIRTPERLDTVMAERLGEQLGLPVKLVQIDPAQQANALTTGQVDLLIGDHIAGQSTPGLTTHNMPVPAGENVTHRTDQSVPAQADQHIAAIPTGYAARPKAIIRSDTTLQHWKDAKGLTVCMSTAAFQAQALAQHWGTIVRTYRVPSDALVAVREGNCDIGLIDDVTWAPLMKFPEWKKFSSSLPENGPRAERVWLIPDHDVATKTWLTDTMKQWRRQGTINTMIEKWARGVAFDVYLDQEVPDCHGG